MRELRSYREACSQLTLGDKKLEEIITMTENKEKTMRRPARVALAAAAIAAALCVSAAAAELPAVKEFFATVFVTVSTNDDLAAGITLPTVSVEEREGRTILLVDGEETDITDALARDGAYLYEGDNFEVRVDGNGAAVITSYGTDGTVVTYSTQGKDGGDVVYYIDPGADGEEPFTVTAGDIPQEGNWDVFDVVDGEKAGSFEVTESGANTGK